MDPFIIFCALVQAVTLLWTASFSLRLSSPLRLALPLLIFAGANLGWLLGRLVG
jgi:hypothetical protein